MQYTERKPSGKRSYYRSSSSSDKESVAGERRMEARVWPYEDRAGQAPGNHPVSESRLHHL